MRLDLEQFEEFDRPSSGFARTVSFVRYAPTQAKMAKRVVFIDQKARLVNKTARQLRILLECRSSHTTLCYGVFASSPQVQIYTEYMDKGSFAAIYKKHGPIDVRIVGKVALAVLRGLVYLYDEHKIIHHDVKPSNVLLNSKGEIKISDFGIYTVLHEYIPAPAFFDDITVYQSPERIQTEPYTNTADTWSLGISLIELIRARHPYASLHLSLVELLHHIVDAPAPRVEFDGKRVPLCEDFVHACLVKDPGIRPTPKTMLKHSWIVRSAADAGTNVEAWAMNV
ncbi:kinase-like protein [Ceratobasidium sp. AG-I]|nr:kinase-like protein [Ceratobasidium sp. AG-I]